MKLHRDPSGYGQLAEAARGGPAGCLGAGRERPALTVRGHHEQSLLELSSRNTVQRSEVVVLRSRLVGVVVLCMSQFPGSAAWAGDLLYASDGARLFTVDVQTGALTFQSGGPLQWIASAAYDEAHHTRFWFPQYDSQPAWLQTTPFSYTWGNPFTGDVGAGVATLSRAAPAPDDWLLPTNMYAYAPTTQRLYTVGFQVDPEIRAIMVDQFNGEAVPDWNVPILPFGNDWTFPTAIAFDPTTSCMMVGMTGGSGHPS